MKLDAWEQALADAMGQRCETVPKDWITLDQYRGNKSPTTARREMAVMLAAHKAERKLFRLVRGDRLAPVPHFRLKKK